MASRLARLVMCAALVAGLAACSSSERPDPLEASTAMESLSIVASNFAADTNVKVVEAHAVLTTDTRGLPLLFGKSPDDIQVADKPEWLLEVEANRPFDCECAAVAASDGHYDPRFMLLLVDPKSFHVDQQGIAHSEPHDLARLGQVEEVRKTR